MQYSFLPRLWTQTQNNNFVPEAFPDLSAILSLLSFGLNSVQLQSCVHSWNCESVFLLQGPTQHLHLVPHALHSGVSVYPVSTRLIRSVSKFLPPAFRCMFCSPFSVKISLSLTWLFCNLLVLEEGTSYSPQVKIKIATEWVCADGSQTGSDETLMSQSCRCVSRRDARSRGVTWERSGMRYSCPC